jgi:hypothetical protein
MIKDELKKIKSTSKELRNFGILVGGVLVAIAALRLQTSSLFIYIVLSGLLLTVFGLIAPSKLKTLYISWMFIAFIIGKISTTIILALLYLCAFIPLSMLLKANGKKLVDTQLDNAATSYWNRRSESDALPAQYEKQF